MIASKTLKLISRYNRILNEDDGSIDPSTQGDPQQAINATDVQDDPSPQIVQMTQQGENEYIKTIFQISTLYLDAIGNVDDKEQLDNLMISFSEDMKNGKVNGRDYYRQYQKIMSEHMPEELRSMLGSI